MAGRVCFIIGALFLAVAVQEIYGQVGGLSKPRPATPKIQGFIDQVRSDVEVEVNRVLEKYVATIYRTQLVNGINYFVKVHTGGGVYMHIRLYRPFDEDQVSFVSLRDGMKLGDKITYF